MNAVLNEGENCHKLTDLSDADLSRINPLYSEVLCDKGKPDQTAANTGRIHAGGGRLSDYGGNYRPATATATVCISGQYYATMTTYC